MPAGLEKRFDERFDWKGQLAGVQEFAFLLGITKSTISRWGNDELLPDPDDTLALGRIWKRQTIEHFLDAIEELSGSRPTQGWKAKYGLSRPYAAKLREEQERAVEAVRRANPGVRRDTPRFEALVRDEYWKRISAAADRRRRTRDQNGSP